MSNAPTLKQTVRDKLTLTALDAINGTAMQPLHCMATLEVTQAQPFQWVMSHYFPQWEARYEHKKFY